MLNKFMTLGHIRNIPYSTTLNSELRNPQCAGLIRTLESANVSKFGWSQGFQTFQSRTPLMEDANVVRNRLNAEFDNLFPTLFPRIRYRGINGLAEKEYKKVLDLKCGDIVEDAGFAYFSKNKDVAKNFAEGVNPVLIKCKIPFWSRVSRMLGVIPSIAPNGTLQVKAGETLLPAGSKFKVLQNSLDKNGVVRLVLKYLK